MIVRLKEHVRENPNPRHTRFQFYDSPIKSIAVAAKKETSASFNSMIVRLKASLKRSPV